MGKISLHQNCPVCNGKAVVKSTDFLKQNPTGPKSTPDQVLNAAQRDLKRTQQLVKDQQDELARTNPISATTPNQWNETSDPLDCKDLFGILYGDDEQSSSEEAKQPQKKTKSVTDADVDDLLANAQQQL